MATSSRPAAFAVVLFTLAITSLFNSCKQEGCTDQTALNYSNVAGKNDGSCIYCKVQEIGSSSLVSNFVDTDSYDQYGNSNPYYYDVVLRFNFDHHRLSSNSDKCPNGECYLHATATNLTGQKITCIASINLNGEQAQVPISVNAGATVDLGKILKSPTGDSFCSVNLENSGVYVNVSGYITYQ